MSNTEQYFLSPEVASSNDLLILGSWILDAAKLVIVPHHHSTAREDTSRAESSLRKLHILNNPEISPPDDILILVNGIYSAIKLNAEHQLGMPLRKLPTRHAAVAHVYLPGDPPGESHVDILPTVPFYVSGPERGGLLYIARGEEIAGRGQLYANSETIAPIPGSYVVFDRHLTHGVEGMPEDASEARISINYTFLPPDEVLQTLDWSHPRLVELTQSGFMLSV